MSDVSDVSEKRGLSGWRVPASGWQGLANRGKRDSMSARLYIDILSLPNGVGTRQANLGGARFVNAADQQD